MHNRLLCSLLASVVHCVRCVSQWLRYSSCSLQTGPLYSAWMDVVNKLARLNFVHVVLENQRIARQSNIINSQSSSDLV